MKAKKVRRKSHKQNAVKEKKDLSKITTEEFFKQDFENDTDSDDTTEQNEKKGAV